MMAVGEGSIDKSMRWRVYYFDNVVPPSTQATCCFLVNNCKRVRLFFFCLHGSQYMLSDFSIRSDFRPRMLE